MPVPVTALRAAAVASLLGSLAFISTVVSAQGLSAREAFLLPVGVVGSGIAALGLSLLVWASSRVLVGVPAWVGAAVVAALCFTVAVAWFDATAIVGIAASTSDSGFDTIGSSAGLTALFVPKSVLGLVGFGALAVTGRRAGVLSRSSAVLFGVGAVAFALPPFPPGVVVVSVAFLLAARTEALSVPRRGSPAPTLSAG